MCTLPRCSRMDPLRGPPSTVIRDECRPSSFEKHRVACMMCHMYRKDGFLQKGGICLQVAEHDHACETAGVVQDKEWCEVRHKYCRCTSCTLDCCIQNTRANPVPLPTKPCWLATASCRIIPCKIFVSAILTSQTLWRGAEGRL